MPSILRCRYRNLFLLFALAVSFVGCGKDDLPTSGLEDPAGALHETPGASVKPEADQEPGAGIDPEPGTPLPGEYIVVLQDDEEDVEGQARGLTAQHGGTPRFLYSHAIKGFSVANLPEQAVEGLRHNPHVRYIEPNRVGSITATQPDAPWGLDRLDQADLPLSSTFTYGNDGSGAHIYLFDTGIRLDHSEFGGRAQYVPNGRNGNFINDTYGSAADCHSHGTQVASVAGGATWGVAKAARLWAGRVADCQGSVRTEVLLAALDWVTAYGQRPAVVNLSLVYGNVQSIRDAVDRSVARGIHYTVAAGNARQDACFESPAGAPGALTVGAVDETDAEASYSNYGTCVDLLAPGVNIRVADYKKSNGSTTSGGTSMAAPHVAGAVALYLSADPGATPAEVSSALTSQASADKITLQSSSLSAGTPNRLLYTAFIGAGSGNRMPTASFTATPVSGTAPLAVSFNASASSDPDGDVLSYAWTFGDGSPGGSGMAVSHTYPAGTYNATLSVSDGEASAIQVKTITVSAPPPPVALQLTAHPSVDRRGIHQITLSWKGTSKNVDVFLVRSTVLSAQTLAANLAGSTYLHKPKNMSGTASYTYKVCEAGTTVCSNEATAAFPIDGATNAPPVASFTHQCTGLSCSFTDGSTDGDGSVASWSWSFGDGTTSTARHPSRTYAAAGTYTVRLTVTDDDNATSSMTRSVTVGSSSGGGSTGGMHAGDLEATSSASGPDWSARIVLAVHDANHVPVTGATVTASWSGGYTGGATCTTGSNGQCTISSGSMPKKNASATLTITGVVHGTLTYSAKDNHDADGDSNGTSVTVSKP